MAFTSPTTAQIFEVPISYSGRTYQEGKKIGFKDGVAALWYIFKFNLLCSLEQSYRVRPSTIRDAHQVPNTAV